MLKFADDTAIQDFMSTSDDTYFTEKYNFVKWCKSNFLILNVRLTIDEKLNWCENSETLLSHFYNAVKKLNFLLIEILND